MKMKKLCAAATVLSLCANMAVCGSTSRAADNQSEENKNVTLCESWTFDAGFYAVVHGGMSSNYGISYWEHNFYDTLVAYEDGEYKGSLAEKWDVSEDGKE